MAMSGGYESQRMASTGGGEWRRWVETRGALTWQVLREWLVVVLWLRISQARSAVANINGVDTMCRENSQLCSGGGVFSSVSFL